jgi:hypothetical protein
MKQFTNLFRHDSYEIQLLPKELQSLHVSLRKPGLMFTQVAKTAPKWHCGPQKGRRPCTATLQRISRRLRAEDYLKEVTSAGNSLGSTKKNLLSCETSQKRPDEILDLVCSSLGQELLQNQLLKKQCKDWVMKIKLLMKREDQALAVARFQRETCKKFLEWYDNEAVRQIADSQDSNAAKIQQLGMLIYGDAW